MRRTFNTAAVRPCTIDFMIFGIVMESSGDMVLAWLFWRGDYGGNRKYSLILKSDYENK